MDKKDIDRRELIQAGPSGVPLTASGPTPETASTIFVPAGADRLEEKRTVFGGMVIEYKILPNESNGSLLALLNTNPTRGGPPRHLHPDQEEWFFVVAGEYAIEVGEEKYRLGPGDSLLAPRKVPHVWAHVGEGTGQLLVSFLPAGKMEAFFTQAAQLRGMPPREELQKLFGEHGMELVGPPLPVS